MQEVIQDVRQQRRPWLVHAKVPLLGHHTSGVRKEFYRTDEDLSQHAINDPGRNSKISLYKKGFGKNICRNWKRRLMPG